MLNKSVIRSQICDYCLSPPCHHIHITALSKRAVAKSKVVWPVWWRERARERRREKDGGRKKEVKQEIQCEVGETEREGGRKREKERWLVLAVKNVSRMIISQWQGSYSAEGGVCKWSAPGHIHMHTHWPCSVMGKKWREKKLELRCEIKGDLLHLSVINHHVITRVYRSLSLSASSLCLSYPRSFCHSLIFASLCLISFI